MNRSIKALFLSAIFVFSGCAYMRIDPMHVLVRSDKIHSLEQEQEIMSRAKVEWTEDKQIRVLYVQGTPYERGYQHGKLLRDEIQENLGTLYKNALDKFKAEELFAEIYERMRPYISQEYIDEMHGLAHGARMPLHVIHHVHVLPSLGEWGGTKRIRKIIKQQMSGELATSCSNFSVKDSASEDGAMYVVRILDWGLHRISKLHEYPLLTVAKPHDGNISLNIGWVGFLGAISGMNDQGITLGEMGYGKPPNETLEGVPMPFLLRDIISYASNLKDVRRIISESPGTNSFVYLMSDGKTGDAELYIRDRDRFIVSGEGETAEDGDEYLPGIQNVVYGGHYNERMTEKLKVYHGKISLELLKTALIPQFSMKSNFQNVIYDPKNLQIWVNNARDRKSLAHQTPYTFFDFQKALDNFPSADTGPVEMAFSD